MIKTAQRSEKDVLCESEKCRVADENSLYC